MPNRKDYCQIAQQYAESVVNGSTLACEWVRLACQRQLNDLARTDWKWRFDQGRAAQVCAFIEKLPHVKGRWSTRNIGLEPWQCFYLTTIFGWVDTKGHRRFRKALVVTPRKNAKTSVAAGVGLYLLVLDQEPGAEIYSAATSRDQAKICWDMARLMAQRTPQLAERYGIDLLAHSIALESRGSFFKPLSRDADSLEGLNVHGAIIDELHAHKTREVFDVLDEGTGSRRQPLLFIISTEGDSSEGVFPEQVDYAKAVLGGQHEDDSFFSVIFTIDKEDNWVDPETWRKANPNLGVSVFQEDLEIRCKQAIANADSQASFLTKRLNVRVGAAATYFNQLAWNTLCKSSGLRMEDFKGQRCMITIDLASKRDLTAQMTVFRQGDDYYVFGRYYLPADAIEPGQPNYDFYSGWAKQGWLTVTEGNVTDYAFVERDLLQAVSLYKPQHVGVDPNYNASHFSNRMMAKGVPMVDVPHNYVFFSEPMKHLDALVVAGRIHHADDPVLGWAMGNVVARKDPKDNVYPRKVRDENKIDPAVALIANLSLHLRQKEVRKSVYASGASM